MNKIHFWLIGFGVCWLAAVFFLRPAFGFVAIGVPIGAIGLGIRQWFMADAHAERQDAAFSNKHVGQQYDKYHYHDIV